MPRNIKLQVRKAANLDKCFVYQLEQTYWSQYAKSIWGEWRHELFEKTWTENSYEIVLLDYLSVGIFRVTKQDTSLYINALHVVPEHRNLGIGTWILDYIEARAKQEELSVKLRVFHTNPAKQLYLRHGFQDVFVDEYWTFMEKRTA